MTNGNKPRKTALDHVKTVGRLGAWLTGGGTAAWAANKLVADPVSGGDGLAKLVRHTVDKGGDLIAEAGNNLGHAWGEAVNYTNVPNLKIAAGLGDIIDKIGYVGTIPVLLGAGALLYGGKKTLDWMRERSKYSYEQRQGNN